MLLSMRGSAAMGTCAMDHKLENRNRAILARVPAPGVAAQRENGLLAQVYRASLELDVIKE
ncbi:hypothetical protein [Andreprevotia sp. IGB-42]|uniref:hypothetical protein n=1 Tax=Andreprevotia sp. IGB-42 TaxID=2497473 RepID=UPI00135A462F|nr:hypothetical protein [Andreprevotia sp. IGB-42]